MGKRVLTAALFAAVLYVQALSQQPDKVSFKVPEGVKVTRDIVYARYGDRDLKLDLYEPGKRRVANLPAIVVIRGGGWRVGDKEGFGPIAAGLAAKGLVAASIEYRASKEAVFPAAVQDAKAAVRWLRANSGKYGLDPDSIGAIGGSAGAHLAVYLGVTAGITELEGSGGNQDMSSSVSAVVGLATPADFPVFAGREGASEPGPVATFLGVPYKQDPTKWKFASPVAHVDRSAAPLLLIQGESDDVVPIDQSLELAKLYANAGVPVEVVFFPGAEHAFWWNTNWFDETVERSAAFFWKRSGRTR